MTVAQISPLPSAPSPTDSREVFNAKAFAQSAALAAFVTEANTLATEVEGLAVDAEVSNLASGASAAAALASQSAATASAQAAAASAGASIWVSGTTYAIGDVRWSPATRYTYRRITAGAGTTDPSADTSNWALLMTPADALALQAAGIF